MTLKKLIQTLLVLLALAALVQFGGLWYTSSSGNSKLQQLSQQSAQMDQKVSAYESSLLSTIEVQNQCAQVQAEKMGISLPVDIQKVGIETYAPFALSVSECIVGFVQSAAQKDAYMYQTGVGMVVLQNLKSAAMSSAGALNQEQVVKTQQLLQQMQPFLIQAWKGSETFWNEYFELKKTIAQHSGFGFWNAGASERVEKSRSERQAQQEQLKQKWEQLYGGIQNPQTTLKPKDS